MFFLKLNMVIKYNFRTKFRQNECYNKMSAINGHMR